VVAVVVVVVLLMVVVDDMFATHVACCSFAVAC